MKTNRMKEPKVQVGIMSEPRIEFVFPTHYQIWGKYCNGVVTYHTIVKGPQMVTYSNGKMLWRNYEFEVLEFNPINEDTDSFELLDVTIGINFHWERKENQRFMGTLKFIVENEKITAVNVINVEDYLTSVISSEMSATASLELLKAHAVISRSWMLASLKGLQIDNSQLTIDNYTMRHESAATESAATESAATESAATDSAATESAATESAATDSAATDSAATDSAATDSAANCQLSTVNCQLKWFGREDHNHFHVCADDHCQRYQGVTRASTEMVKQAIAATRGQVLMSGGKICDARFSKCCGGAFEEFRYCWEEKEYSYLKKQRDFRIFSPKTCNLSFEATQPGSGLPDLTIEWEAESWIRRTPPAYCNTTDKEILSQVLNNYDQETTDFYRWKVAYTQDELSLLIKERSGIDYGQIIDLVPIARGTSARLWKLKIVGTKKTLIIGKELEIRRTLSASHLYSSAFVVDKEEVSAEGIPGRFVLTGAGWGHGVGLCQIGAAVMGEQGYLYDAILKHYYIGADIDKLYD